MAGSASVSKMTRKRLLVLLDGGHCYYCGCEFSPERYRTIEHIVPISRGGSKHESNLAWTCNVCNGEKADMTGDEYLTFLGRGGELTRHGSYANVVPMGCFYINTCANCLTDFKSRNLNHRYCKLGCREEQKMTPRPYKEMIFELAEAGLLI